MYAQVCFPFFISKTFTYKIPNKLVEDLKAGDLVQVKFKNKLCKGFVTQTSKTIYFKGKLNSILSIDSTQIPHDLWKTIVWMSNYYVTPIGKITQTTLSWAFKNNTVKNQNLNTDEYHCKSIESIKLSDIQKNIYNQI